MTVTIFFTVGLKWSMTTAIFGSLLGHLAGLFTDRRPFTALAIAACGAALSLVSIATFLYWLWSI